MLSIVSKALLPLAILSLSACATVPSANPLMAGIDKSEIGDYDVLRAANDPICVNLYKNMANYVPAPEKANSGGNFLASMALGVLASAATGGVVSGIDGTVARMAAGSAMRTATDTAGNAALNSMQREQTAFEQKQKAAEAVGCPMPAVPMTSAIVDT